MNYSQGFIIILVACFGFTFCRSESKELKYPEQTTFSSIDTVTKQNLLLYSLPNPLSVSYIIHTAQIDFNEKYLTQYQSEIIVGEVEKEKRATQLGFLLVEYGYLTFYEKQQYSLSYVKKIEELLRMLDLQNQKTIQAIGLLKSNMTNRDSINQLILNTYEDFGIDLIEQKNDKLALYIANGVFIQSLYILCDVYNEMQKRPNFIEVNGTINDYRAMLVQFRFYLSNMLELFKPYETENREVYNLLIELDNDFEEMTLNWGVAKETGNIENVSFRRSVLHTIKEKIIKYRTFINM